MRLFLPLFLFMLLFSFPPVQAYTVCSCSDPGTPQEALDRAFSVFIGTVDDVRRQFSPDRHKVTFKVEQAWKGVRGDEISVYSSGTDTVALLREGLTCGFDFKRGERYLVYSFRKRNRNGPAFVSRCSRTRSAENAGEDIKALGVPLIIFDKHLRR